MDSTENDNNKIQIEYQKEALSLVDSHMDALQSSSSWGFSFICLLIGALKTDEKPIEIFKNVSISKVQLAYFLLIIMPIIALHYRRLWNNLESNYALICDKHISFRACMRTKSYGWILNPFSMTKGGFNLYMFVSNFLVLTIWISALMATMKFSYKLNVDWIENTMKFLSGFITGVLHLGTIKSINRIHIWLYGAEYPMFLFWPALIIAILVSYCIIYKL